MEAPKAKPLLPPSSSQVKRKSGDTTKGKPPVKRSKNDSPAPIPKEDKGELNDLKQKLRHVDLELRLKSARDRNTRLEGKEDQMKKSYDDLRNKNDEFADEFAELKELKVATFNHFLATWEIKNENKQGDEISALKNVFPLTLRKFFTEEIKKDKDSLK